MKKSPPVRPGLVLKKLYLDSQQMSVDDLAEKIDLKVNDISSIIKGKTSISPEMMKV